MTDQSTADKLYGPPQHITLDDLHGLHQNAATELADRPDDREDINREVNAIGLGAADAKSLIYRMTGYANSPQDDRARLRMHGDAERAMSQMDRNWDTERAHMVKWLQSKAPGLHRLLVTTGAANDIDVLLELRGAYRRSRVRG